MRAVSSSVLPPGSSGKSAQAVGDEQDDLGLGRFAQFADEIVDVHVGEFTPRRIMTYSIGSSDRADITGHCTARTGIDPMQLPDENIEYNYQRLLAPAGRGVDARSPSCSASTSSAPTRLDEVKKEADRRPRPGRRRARTRQRPPPRTSRSSPGSSTCRRSARRVPPQAGRRANSARSCRIANRLREDVDRVVVLGIGGCYLGAKALFDALCHTYHNELPANLRMGKPRMYFEGNNVDNDALQDLLELLENTCVDPEICRRSAGARSSSASRAARWKRPRPTARCRAEIDAVLRLRRRRPAAGASSPITGPKGKLRDLCDAERLHRRRHPDHPRRRRRPVLRVHAGRPAAGGGRWAWTSARCCSAPRP